MIPASSAEARREEQVDGLDAIMRGGGQALRERMVRTERHLERVTEAAGAPLA
jgi:hypothetical protein